MSTSAPAPQHDNWNTDFSGFLRAAGKLAGARQLAALVFLGAVLALPTITSTAASTQFVWAYFSVLTVSSFLALGFERLAGLMATAEGDGLQPVAPLVVLRILLVPIMLVVQWLVLEFVGVALPSSAWVAAAVWTWSALLEPVAFAALRTRGDTNTEPVTMAVVRVVQAAALLSAAALDAGVAVMVWAVAAAEMAGALVALRRVGRWRTLPVRASSFRAIPLRQSLALAGIDVVALVNLRVDLLVVGRMAGAVAGVTYGLAYRIVDAFNGIVGSVGLWLYAESLNERDGATSADGIRGRSLVLLPRLGILAAVVVVVSAGWIADLVPHVVPDVATVRALAIAFPLLTVNGIEVHARSGRGRNREILGIFVATLTVNVIASIVFVGRFGLVGGAIALVLSELIQTVALWVAAATDERGLMRRPLAIAGGGVLLLAAAALALQLGHVVLAGFAVAGVAVVVLWPGPARNPVEMVT